MPAKPRSPRTAKPSMLPMVLLFIGGAGIAVVVFGAVVVLWLVLGRGSDDPDAQAHGIDPAAGPAEPKEAAHAKATPWWDDPARADVAQAVTLLQSELPQDQKLFDRLGDRGEPVRLAAYRDLLAKAPELILRPQPKRLLGRFISVCCALDPADGNEAELESWLVKQLPEENAEFPATLTADDLERSFWALEVSMDALGHSAMAPPRRKRFADALSTAFGIPVDPAVPATKLKKDIEEHLARRCYRKLVPPAGTSLEHALALRDALLRTVSQHLDHTFRAKRDVEIATNALPQASNAWPAYSTLVRACLKTDDIAIEATVVDVYAQADAALAAKFEPILAERWAVAADAKLKQAAKARMIRKALGIPDPAERLEVLAKVAKDARTVAADPANKRNATLQEMARLAHASTLACALWRKDAGLAKFDELVANIPVIDQRAAKVAAAPKAAGDPVPKGGVPGAGKPLVITGTLAPGANKRLHPVPLKRGRMYAIHMVSPFDNYLYLHDARGRLLAQDDDSGGGLNALIRFMPPVDGTYTVTASSFGGFRFGPYTITIQEIPPGAAFVPGLPRFPIRGFPPPPPFMPGPPVGVVKQEPAGKDTTDTQTQIDQGDLDALKENLPANRIAALHRIVTKLPKDSTENDMASPPARAIARYLLTVKTNAELDEVLPKIAPLAKSRAMLLALADRVDQDAELSASEGVVGTLLKQPLRFTKDDDWRLTCRKLLLQQAIDLGGRANAATGAARIMRDLYAEQAALLGVDPASLKDISRPSQMLAKVIDHVLGKLDDDKLADADKRIVAQVHAQLAVAPFLAQNDLEHTALLQRAWIHVLPVYLAQQHPERAAAMRKAYDNLIQADVLSRTILDQLRGGEDQILRVWAAALDMQ